MNLTTKSSHSTSADNSSTSDYSLGLPVDIPPITLGILILLANGFVIVLVVRKQRLRSLTNLLLCSLALSDLLTGVISIPLFLMCNLLHKPGICIAEDQMLRFTSISTVCHLVAVSVDRYLAIIHPLRYKAIFTHSRCISVILSIWLLSATMALIQLSWMNPVDHDPHQELTPDVIKKENIYDVTCVLAFTVVPLVCMVFVYARIFNEVSRQIEFLRKQTAPDSQDSRKLKYVERKVVTTFAVMLLVYAVCWLPYFVLRLYRLDHISVIIMYVILWLRFLSSFLNPCLYIFGKKDFRSALKWSGRKDKRYHYKDMIPLKRVGAPV